MVRILITGSNGQVGSEIIEYLRKTTDCTILATDITQPKEQVEGVQFEYMDVKERVLVESVFRKFKPEHVYHLAAILSATGEKDPVITHNVNTTGTMNILSACVTHGVQKAFIPSTIGVYGPEIQKENAPLENYSTPTTMYGITKATSEMLFKYYHARFDLDVRSVRYPGLISYKVEPTAGTTDFSVDMIKHAALGKKYICYLKSDTRLPMMYMPDAMINTIKMMYQEKVEKRIYNFMAYSISPGEIESIIKERIPDFHVEYVPDYRQAIADSWPASINIEDSVNDWGFDCTYDAKKTVDDMLDHYASTN